MPDTLREFRTFSIKIEPLWDGSDIDDPRHFDEKWQLRSQLSALQFRIPCQQIFIMLKIACEIMLTTNFSSGFVRKGKDSFNSIIYTINKCSMNTFCANSIFCENYDPFFNHRISLPISFEKAFPPCGILIRHQSEK